jgi:hypothetical protein
MMKPPSSAAGVVRNTALGMPFAVTLSDEEDEEVSSASDDTTSVADVGDVAEHPAWAHATTPTASSFRIPGLITFFAFPINPQPFVAGRTNVARSQATVRRTTRER